MAIWDDIQAVVNQLVAFRDAHVALSVNVRTLDSGQVYIDLGQFGNSTQPNPQAAYTFLGGVLMGMNINRG